MTCNRIGRSLRCLALAGTMFVSVARLAAAEESQAGNPKAGKDVFENNCVICHGASGTGKGPGSAGLKARPANFTDPARMSKISEEVRAKAVMFGGRTVGVSRVMPAFKDVLTEEEIRDVLAYVRQEFSR